MNKPIRTKTPSGEDIVILPAADYELLMELAEDAVDVRNAERALAEIAAGKGELLTHDEVLQLLDAPSPLAFWRRRRGLTQAALAQAVGVSQAYLAQIEGAKRTGEVGLYGRLANKLDVEMEDLLPAADAPRRKRTKKRRKK